MDRSSVNVMVMKVDPRWLEEVIALMPAMVENCRSIRLPLRKRTSFPDSRPVDQRKPSRVG